MADAATAQGILATAVGVREILIAVAGLVLLALASLWVWWRSRPRDYSLGFGMVVVLNWLLCKVWYRQRRVGCCTVPRSGPVLVVPNHTCTPDPLLVYAACPYRKFAFMIAREYASMQLWGYFVRISECIPVRRDGRDVGGTKAAIRRLRKGKAMGVFIEGGIPEPGEPAQPKDGPALLALRTGAVVIPCHISGTKYRDGILAGFLARHRARVRFGEPVDLSDLTGGGRRDALPLATRRIVQAISALAPQAESAREKKQAIAPPRKNRDIQSRDRKGADSASR